MIPVPIQVAGEAVLHSACQFLALEWSADGATFSDTFRVLQLSSYDNIIGLDHRGKYSPMVTDWKQGWISIQHDGRQVVLHNDSATHSLMLLSN
jgi:hypothetical protein